MSRSTLGFIIGTALGVVLVVVVSGAITGHIF